MWSQDEHYYCLQPNGGILGTKRLADLVNYRVVRSRCCWNEMVRHDGEAWYLSKLNRAKCEPSRATKLIPSSDIATFSSSRIMIDIVQFCKSISDENFGCSEGGLFSLLITKSCFHATFPRVVVLCGNLGIFRSHPSRLPRTKLALARSKLALRRGPDVTEQTTRLLRGGLQIKYPLTFPLR